MKKNESIRVIRADRKTLSMRIVGEGQVEIRAPRTVTQGQIDDFIRQHQDWLDRQLQITAELRRLPPLTEAEIRALGQRALKAIPPRVQAFARRIGVDYGRITIRNQKSKWGSCSSQGNLNFNCLLMLCPPEVLDYVVAHELCHRLEMNHSPRFWALLEQVIPDYEARRQWLKTEGAKLIARMERGAAEGSRQTNGGGEP